jgi:hypothetical protein
MKNNPWKRALMGGMVAALLSHCGPHLDAKTVIAEGGKLTSATPQDPTPVGSPTDVLESFSKDGDWNCTTQKYTAESAPQDLATFEPNADVIWPGSLVQGATLQSGAPEPIAVKRAGGTVLMNLVNAAPGIDAKSYQVQLAEMTQGNVIDAQNRILANNTGGTPAAFDFSKTEVDSEEELAFAMDANVKWLSGSVGTKLSFTTDKRYSRVLVKLTQRYYTMVYQTPTSLDEILDPSVTAEQLSAYVRPGDPATYISSVTYGRQFYLLVESTASMQDLETSLDVAYEGLANADVNAQATYKTTSSSMIVHAFAVGGGAQAALDGVLAASDGKLDGLHDFLVAGATIDAKNPGLPLSYEVRSVVDNTLVNVGIASEFVRKTCIPVIPNDASMALWLDAQSLPQYQVTTPISTWKGSSFTQNDGLGHASYVPATINGHPSMFFTYDDTLGWDYFNVSLGDGKVVNTDYTVISVIRAAGSDLQAENRGGQYGWAVFLEGGQGNCTDCNLHLGFDGSGDLIHGHYNDDMHSQAVANSGGDVLTFRFSQAKDGGGKSDFQNGALLKNDPTATRPLLANGGARIGSSFSIFYGFLGEVRVYSYAMSPLQQKTVECELGAKWSINVAGCVNGKPDPAKMQF